MVPAYVVSTFAIFIVALWETEWALQVPIKQLMLQLGHWLGFGFLPMPAINGWAATPAINAMVYWTLPYEWLFYLCLPLCAVMVAQSHLIRLLTLTWLCFLTLNRELIAIYFILGATAARLHNQAILRQYATGWAGMTISAASLILFFFYRDTAYDWSSAILLFCFFAPIALGQTYYGLLTTAPLRLLGCVSYSLYLLHGIALYILGSTIGYASDPWQTATLAVIATFAISCLTYRWVEYPFLKVARRGDALPTRDMSSCVAQPKEESA